MSDTSVLQNEEMMSVKEEPLLTLVSIKEEEKNIDWGENNEDCKTELLKVKQKYVLHKCIKQEYYTNNLIETHQDPLAINYSDVENVKKEYSYVEDIKEELSTKVQEECKYEDSKWSIDIVEHKVENSVSYGFTNIYEDSIPGSSNIREDTVLIKGHEVHKECKAYECKICLRLFSQAVYLKKHMNRVHKVIKNYNCYECKKCNKIFPSAVFLKNHINSMHKDLEVCECKECYQVFSQAKELKSHMKGTYRKHTNEAYKGLKSYECNECHKIFCSSLYVRQHVDSVHKGLKTCKMQICSQCHKVFFDAVNLKRHMNIMHKGITNYNFNCNKCCKLFSSAQCLKLHICSVHKEIKN